MKGPSLSLRLRIFLATMAVIVGLLLLTYGVMQSLVGRILQTEIEDGLERARRAQSSFTEMSAVVLLDQARSVTQVPHLRAVLGTPDVDESTVRYTITTLGETLDSDLLFVCDAQGVVLAENVTGGGRPERHPAIARALAGRETCCIWEDAQDTYLVALSPVTMDGAVLGLVGLGFPLQQHARDLQRVTGLDVTLMRDGQPLALAWAREEFEPPPRAEPARWAGLAAHGDTRLVCGGREYMATSVPLADLPVDVVLSRPLDDVVQHFLRARKELLLVGLAIVGVGLLVSRWVSGRISRPIRQLTLAANELARGELGVVVDAHAQDEIGLLATAFNDMARQLSALMDKTMEKARAAEQASEAKSVFLATMSHEVRTPLNGVLGFAEQLAATALTAEQREYLDFVRRSGQDLLAIIDEILAFAKLEAGQVRLDEAEFSVESCVERALDPLRQAIAAKGLDLAVRIDAGVPECLVGPAGRLRQILANYAANALKFTARGKVDVDVALAAQTEGDVVLRVSVRDTGIGIAPEHLGQLFKPFAQLDSRSSREYGGTGLGLAICKELAALMQGEVGVASVPGAGSTFWFTAVLRKPHAASAAPASPRAPLPAARRAQAELPAPVTNDAAARERRGAQRILVAEDNPVNQRVLAVVLQKAGFSHALAANGGQAVELFAAQPFDLVLMDCQMPVLDGLEATQRIRALAGGASVPIVALTANAFAGDRDACLAAGMDDFVAKPFEAGALIARLDGWLSAQRSVITES